MYFMIEGLKYVCFSINTGSGGLASKIKLPVRNDVTRSGIYQICSFYFFEIGFLVGCPVFIRKNLHFVVA